MKLRRCPMPINEETSLEAQSWILPQIAEELLAQSADVVLCDRGVVDNYAYLARVATSRCWMLWLADGCGHATVVLVPVVTTASADGMRATDPGFQRNVDELVRDELARRGTCFVDLSQVAREDWLEHVEARVLERLQPPQLDLL